MTFYAKDAKLALIGEYQSFRTLEACVYALVGWVPWLVCRWPSVPKVVGSTTAQVDGFFYDAKNRLRPCRMVIQHAMERLVVDGLAKSIGLSNCNRDQIERILSVCKIKPANLQIECHAYLPQQEMVDFCKSINIAVTAYAPLGTPGFGPYVKKKYNVDVSVPVLINEEVVKSIAASKGKTPAQILIRFLIQRDIAVIPKSSNPDHQKENLQVFDFNLSQEEMDVLYKLDRNFRYFTFNLYPNMLLHPEHPFK
ncbi:1,5-anhydro-D-fructose reductase [Trichonephila clavipes]|nr:1,5-anhydro-D-fructose reductase [Trichonephila clavipes]